MGSGCSEQFIIGVIRPWICHHRDDRGLSRGTSLYTELCPHLLVPPDGDGSGIAKGGAFHLEVRGQAEIAGHLQGEVLGDGSTVLTGFAPADKARPGDLTFAENETYFQRADASAASAVVISFLEQAANRTPQLAR